MRAVSARFHEDQVSAGVARDPRRYIIHLSPNYHPAICWTVVLCHLLEGKPRWGLHAFCQTSIRHRRQDVNLARALRSHHAGCISLAPCPDGTVRSSATGSSVLIADSRTVYMTGGFWFCLLKTLGIL